MVVLFTGWIAGFALFGVCNERTESGICDSLVPGQGSHLLLGLFSALLVITIGLLFGRRAVGVSMLLVIAAQATIAITVAVVEL